MAINLIHVSDIHLGAGQSHGRLNPETGLNVRLEDYARAFACVVDYAIDNQADAFLFSGDAYRTSTPEPVEQKLFAAQLKRLSSAGIPTVLLVGNHDLVLRSTGSHSLSVFQTLAVPGVLTVERPTYTSIDTKKGPFQLIAIPYVTRHQLMTLEKYSGLSGAETDRLLIDHVTAILKSYYDRLNPSEPAVVTAHMTVDSACAGIEKELLVGHTLTFPADIFVDERLDYVALGHVHRHQVIRQRSPTIVYAGSLERVDFSEQDEDKGFVHVRLARNKTAAAFKSIGPRRFVTIDQDVRQCQDPTDDLLRQLSSVAFDGSVLRLRIKIRQEQLALLCQERLRQASCTALSLRIQLEVEPLPDRVRLPELNYTLAASPLEALRMYLKEVLPERQETLIERARELLAGLEAEERCT